MARFQFFRADGRLVRWRLLGGNNRVLGVSSRASADHTAALRDATAVREHAAGADFDVEHVASGLWCWHMNFPDPHDEAGPPVPLATSGRGFARRVDASLAAERFQARAPVAELDLTLAVFEPGRRGREVSFSLENPEIPESGEIPEATAMRPKRPVC